MSSKSQHRESRLPISRPDRGRRQLPRCGRERKADANALVAILRRITLAVQVFPFFYTVLFVILFLAYYCFPGPILDIVDYVFFVSPVVALAHLIYSRMLKLCKWHRMACALPLLPQSVDVVDNYVYHFGAFPKRLQGRLDATSMPVRILDYMENWRSGLSRQYATLGAIRWKKHPATSLDTTGRTLKILYCNKVARTNIERFF